MRQYSLMIAVGVLGLGTITLSGCGKKPDAEQPQAQIKNETSSTSSPIDAPKAEEVKLVHEMDPAKHHLPSGTVRATFGGITFPMEAFIEDENLIFRTVKSESTSTEQEIRVKLGSYTDPHSFESKHLIVKQDETPGPKVPEILVKATKDNLRLFPNGYALTLQVGTRQNWKLPGNIYLCLPDEEKTVLAGTFFAAFPRQPTEPPGPEDLPYIKGSVAVIGAQPTNGVRVGYIVDERPGMFSMGSADLTLGEITTSVGWVRNESDKPRVTMLLPGDGKQVSCRYEHSKLTTGRYLVYASLLPDGPIAWKWVAVLPGETHTIDLTLDATQTGGIEVNTPVEAVKNVEMAPADKPGFHQLDPSMFTACAWQFKLEKPIIARKAVFKNLSPGRYEVRAAGQTRIVEIVAGKMLELDFDKIATNPTTVEPAPEPREKK
jgi:hypothetical protein